MIKLFHHPATKALRVIQFFLAVLIFFYAALAPSGNTPSKVDPMMLHLVGNVLLSLSAWLALASIIRLKYLFLLCLVLSCSAEFAQSLTSSRITDISDFFSNFAGLILGFTICRLAQPLFYPSDRSLEVESQGTDSG